MIILPRFFAYPIDTKFLHEYTSLNGSEVIKYTQYVISDADVNLLNEYLSVIFVLFFLRSGHFGEAKGLTSS